MKQEISAKPISGYLALLVAILFLGGAIAGFAYEIIWLGVFLTLLFTFTIIGFTVVYLICSPLMYNKLPSKVVIVKLFPTVTSLYSCNVGDKSITTIL